MTRMGSVLVCALGFVPKNRFFPRGGGYKRKLVSGGKVRRLGVGCICGGGRLYVRGRQGTCFLLVCPNFGSEMGGDYSGGLLRRL